MEQILINVIGILAGIIAAGVVYHVVMRRAYRRTLESVASQQLVIVKDAHRVSHAAIDEHVQETKLRREAQAELGKLFEENKRLRKLLSEKVENVDEWLDRESLRERLAAAEQRLTAVQGLLDQANRMQQLGGFGHHQSFADRSTYDQRLRDAHTCIVPPSFWCHPINAGGNK